MEHRYLSDPLDDLLQRAGLAPATVDKALERLALTWQPTVLKPGHPYLRQIRERTGTNVVAIWRKYRRLLVEVEQFRDGKFLWQYHERSRTDCMFACLGEIPETTARALIDHPLRDLIVPTPALGAVAIQSISHDRAGWLTLAVAPEWRQF